MIWAQARRRLAGWPELKTRHHVVVPADRPLREADLPSMARVLVAGLRRQARDVAAEPADLIVVDRRRRRLWRLEDGLPLGAASFIGQPFHVFMNAAFLLADPPPLAGLLARARLERTAWCGFPSTGDAHAFAFAGDVKEAEMWAALALLAAGPDEPPEPGWAMAATESMLPPTESAPENSPAMEGVTGLRRRRGFHSPRYLNTALREALTEPRDTGEVGSDPERMAVALHAQREASRVPWIFNALLNDVEYRLGTSFPRSFPPELHLSLTGLCNVECRFCGYTHGEARPDRVAPEQVARLDFLPNAQTLRLNSGLGEPTANASLATVVQDVVARFPHLGLNFFTNAISLNRPGLRGALVGNVRWINVSLNAATAETWREVCQADFFGRVCDNLRDLLAAKREARRPLPLVFASTVLTRANLDELPLMPGLCRDLGIDRLTAFPYYAFITGPEKYGPEMTLEACRDRYDALYEETIRAAEANRVSLEIPLPSERKRAAFGLEVRPLRDFARIESNEWPLGRLVSDLAFDRPWGAHCHFLWRQAAIGSTHARTRSRDTHYLYPCLGPLAAVDFSERTAFRFPDGPGFLQLWSNPVFARLRRAQRQEGVCDVCDACRHQDTRDPRSFARLAGLVSKFSKELEDGGPGADS